MLAFVKAFDNFSGEETADLVANVPPLLRKSRASDVTDFWTCYGFGLKPDISVRVLLNSLYDYASDAGMLPVERENENPFDNMALVEFFAGRRRRRGKSGIFVLPSIVTYISHQSFSLAEFR